MKSLYFLFSMLLVILITGCSEEPTPDPAADELENLTGYPARLTWIQDTGTPGGGDYQATGTHHRLKVFCTREGRPRVLHHREGMNYYSPLITSDGQHVVFSNRHEETIYVIPWQGGEPEPVAEGRALAIWNHPETGEDWVYLIRDPGDGEENRHLYRRPLFQNGGETPHEEFLWDTTRIGRLQVSADGNMLAAEFDWPATGYIDLASGQWERVANGCWPAMAPDNSYLMWVFTGTHRAMEMFSLPDNRRWTVTINQHDKLAGMRTYHPQWSNHPDFIVLTGPYEGQFWEQRERVNIFVAQFNEERTQLKNHLQVTDNGVMDIMPSLWIAHDETWEPREEAGLGKAPPDQAAPEAWPTIREHKVFLWRDHGSNNDFHSSLYHASRTGQVRARQYARFGRMLEMRLHGGWFDLEISPSRLADKLQQTSELTIEMLVHQQDYGTADEVSGQIFQTFDAAGSAGLVLGADEKNWTLLARDGTGAETHTAHPKATELGANGSAATNHVALRISGNSVDLAVDGEWIGRAEVDLGLANWKTPTLRAGGESAAPVGLSHLSAIALALPDFMIAESANASLSDHREKEFRAPESILLRARVAVASETPDPGGIEPYRRALVSHEYEVLEVAEGDYSSDRIVVAHWALMDGQVREEGRRETGQELWMRVEPQADHPQLEGEFMVTGDEDIFLEPYYQVDF